MQSSRYSALHSALFRLLTLCVLFACRRVIGAESKPAEHTFILQNFQTESGVTLPEARIMYGTYGTLNAAHDNAVLLPSHYMATCTGMNG